jgi:hypothetical protein
LARAQPKAPCKPAPSVNVPWADLRSGEPGNSVRVERSRGLVNRKTAATVSLPAMCQTLIDPAAATEPLLFYRAVSVA